MSEDVNVGAIIGVIILQSLVAIGMTAYLVEIGVFKSSEPLIATLFCITISMIGAYGVIRYLTMGKEKRIKCQ